MAVLLALSCGDAGPGGEHGPAVLVEGDPGTGRGLARRASGVPAGSQKVVVTGHTDGDTIRLRLVTTGVAGRRGEELRVRLLEVDAPEMGGPRSDVEECYAAEASTALARLVPVGSTAWAGADRDLLDPYGRTLLYLWTVRDGEFVFVNRRLVARGFATAALYEPNDRYIDVMRAAERRAQLDERGLWGACGWCAGRCLAWREGEP
ncbi:MAG: thermonuclease family protein [Nocardioidaceae bacterium]